MYETVCDTVYFGHLEGDLLCCEGRWVGRLVGDPVGCPVGLVGLGDGLYVDGR